MRSWQKCLGLSDHSSCMHQSISSFNEMTMALTHLLTAACNYAKTKNTKCLGRLCCCCKRDGSISWAFNI